MHLINQPAPQFSAQAVEDGGHFRDITLSDYKGKWVVLFFYPLDFTFVCPTEITQFSQNIEEFKKLDAEVIGCSVDSIHSHKRWLQQDLNDLGYPLMSDITKRISKDYGVLIEQEGISTRATFIISPEQSLQYIAVHSLNVGREASEILRVLHALQSGELCQAGWKPGDKHIHP